MSNIKRRIDTIEKQLNLGKHETRFRLCPPVITTAPTNSGGKDIDKLGPLETWITYQEQLQTQEKANAEHLKDNPTSFGAAIFIRLDVDKEYQARQRKTTKNNDLTESEVMVT